MTADRMEAFLDEKGERALRIVSTGNVKAVIDGGKLGTSLRSAGGCPPTARRGRVAGRVQDVDRPAQIQPLAAPVRQSRPRADHEPVHPVRRHEEGYTVVRNGDGTLRFSTPGGWAIPDVPAPPRVPRAPMPALVAANRAHGLMIDARTGLPAWCGERLDLGWAIDVLHPAANPAAYR